MSDAFSAIIIVGALVLPEGMVGIIEASAILKDSIPLTCNLLFTTANLSDLCPIFAVPIIWYTVIPSFLAQDKSFYLGQEMKELLYTI